MTPFHAQTARLPKDSLGLTFQYLFGGLNDALVVKFDNLRARRWGTYFGGTGNETGDFITVTNNSVYFAGYGIAIPACTMCSGYNLTTTSNSADIYLAKLDETFGSRNPATGMSTYLGGTAGREIHGMTSDNLGNIYFFELSCSRSHNYDIQ